jgi:hypothetical protein
VIIRQEALHLSVPQHGFEELCCDIGVEQSVTVLRECRMIPHGIIDAEPNEPAEQQIVVDLLHQLALGAHRVEGLQQRGAQQALGCDRLAPRALVEPLELGIERGQHVVDDCPDRAQRVLGGHALFQVNVGEQRSRRGIRSAHAGPHCPADRTESYSLERVTRR